MAVTTDEVKYIAALARLQYEEAELPQIAKELSAILSYMDTLNELDTENVKPMTHVLDLKNVFREDEEPAEGRITHDEALKNAPDADSEYFRVPKVIS